MPTLVDLIGWWVYCLGPMNNILILLFIEFLHVSLVTVDNVNQEVVLLCSECALSSLNEN